MGGFLHSRSPSPTTLTPPTPELRQGPGREGKRPNGYRERAGAVERSPWQVSKPRPVLRGYSSAFLQNPTLGPLTQRGPQTHRLALSTTSAGVPLLPSSPCTTAHAVHLAGGKLSILTSQTLGGANTPSGLSPHSATPWTFPFLVPPAARGCRSSF